MMPNLVGLVTHPRANQALRLLIDNLNKAHDDIADLKAHWDGHRWMDRTPLALTMVHLQTSLSTCKSCIAASFQDPAETCDRHQGLGEKARPSQVALDAPGTSNLSRVSGQVVASPSRREQAEEADYLVDPEVYTLEKKCAPHEAYPGPQTYPNIRLLHIWGLLL